MKHIVAFRTRSIPALLAVAMLLGATPSPAQSTAGTPASNGFGPVVPIPLNPPIVTTSIQSGREVISGEQLCFTVSASYSAHLPFSLRCLNPPDGMVFATQRSSAGRLTANVDWTVGRMAGLRTVVFEARDEARPEMRTRLDVVFREVGGSSGLRIGDVTGDGILDTICGASAADVGGVTNAGAVYVWAGTTSPAGAPTATLTVPGAQPGDYLGQSAYNSRWGASGASIQLGDVTGDGVLDVVVIATSADASAINSGSIYVWTGGAGLQGIVAPTDQLHDPWAMNDDRICDAISFQGLQLVDITGDGVLDLIAAAPYLDYSPYPYDADKGGVFVWRGGAPVTYVGYFSAKGDPFLPFGYLSGYAGYQGVRLGDVTGDGTEDLIVGGAYEGMRGQGSINVYAGGMNLGPITAHLEHSSADRLGEFSGYSIQLVDVTGDGLLDVVAGSTMADIDANNTGAIYVWEGGDALTPGGGGGFPAQPNPLAVLSVPGASENDMLGNYGGEGQSLLVSDVTGDGFLDIIASARSADIDGVQDTGAVYVWAGGPALSTTARAPAVLAVPGAASGDQLGHVETGRDAIHIADVSGDGIQDIVVVASQADIGPIVDAGAVYVWTGGATLTGAVAPTASLHAPGAHHADEMCSGLSRGLEIRDLTGDGIEDVITKTPAFDVNEVKDSGAIHIWMGGAGLAGTPPPIATLTIPDPTQEDRLGQSTRLCFADVTGDDMPDVVATAYLADINSIRDAGAVYAWAGGKGLVGTPPPTASLHLPNPRAEDQFGRTDGRLQLADISGDGQVDIIVGAHLANVRNIVDAGRIAVWLGGPSLVATPDPLADLAIPQPTQGDQLGEAYGHSIRLADINADGQLDLLAATLHATINGVAETGAVFFWTGPFSSPVADPQVLAVPGAAPHDQLGR